MKAWIGLSTVGLALVAGILFLRTDMRGWPPSNWTDPTAVVEPIDKNDPAFTIGDCLPGTVDPFQTPSGRDYGGTATAHVFTCRSRSSAVKITVLYLLVALSYPAYRLFKRKRS